MSIGGSTESNVRSFETFVTIYLSICNYTKYRVSQNWRTNCLLPNRGYLNVHEKNVFDKKINYFYYNY
jgi:hypothetical protein